MVLHFFKVLRSLVVANTVVSFILSATLATIFRKDTPVQFGNVFARNT